MDIDVEAPPVQLPDSYEDARTEHGPGTQPFVPEVPVPPPPDAEVRANAVFLYGVDNMSSEDVEAYIQNYYPKPFYMEWINDSSLNISYDAAEDAFQFLVNITDADEFDKDDRIEPTQLRQTRPHPNSNAVFQARFATTADVKPSGARARSRYYLLHGTPSRKEDLIRFGSKRTIKPMRYGGVKDDLLKPGHRMPEDLFPSKRPKDPKAVRRANEQLRKARVEEPDLFASKITAASQAGKISKRRRRKRGAVAEKQTAETVAKSIYSNMNY